MIILTRIAKKPIMINCSTCKKSFSCKSSLTRHVKSVHNKIKNHKCGYSNCDIAFTCKSDLNRHIAYKHSKKTHLCMVKNCDASFAWKTDLKNHVKHMHNDIRDYTCTVEGCNEAFHTLTKLKRHIYCVHEDNVNINCNYEGCNMKFNLPENLKRHIKIVHMGIRYLTCANKMCDITFTQKADLKKHLKICTNGISGSSGEVKIKKYLDSINLSYLYNKQFNVMGTCGRLLRWDFIIEGEDGPIFIEYDGKHHFEPVRFGNISHELASEKFKLQQIHDKMKDDFCRNNDYMLLRIKYNDYDNIDKIIEDFINEHFDIVDEIV